MADNNKSGHQQRECKRPASEVLSWDDYFMGAAFLSGMRSKDPNTQVGACIVNEKNRIVGLGYNGMPNDCSDDELPWGRDKKKGDLNTKHLYVCHAEMNAIMNNTSASLDGCRIYVGLFPCNECAKLIIQSGIKKVIYVSDKHEGRSSTNAAKKMLNMVGVKLMQYSPQRKTITVDFDVIDKNVKKLDEIGHNQKEKCSQKLPI